MSGKQQKKQFLYSIATQYSVQIWSVTLVHTRTHMHTNLI